jgi:hypothetical protein
MSQINVDVILPQSGNSVTVNGVNLSSPNNDPTNIAIACVPTSVAITSHNNTLIGGAAAGGLTTGYQNTAIGTYACQALTTGFNNVAVGMNSLFANTTGSSNIAIGANAAISQASGSDTVAIGDSALRFCTDFSNVAIGTSALRNLITGFTNVSIGRNSGQGLTNGTGNTFLGAQSGQAIATGSNNTVVGFSAGDVTILNGSNNTIIGYNAEASSSVASNQITLGNSSVTTLRCAVTSITSLSDERDKDEITDLSAGLDFINEIKPVSFVWKDRNEEGKQGIKDSGFTAQNLKEVQEKYNLVEELKLVHEENPEKLEASYGRLIPILVKAIQDLSKEVEQLKNK